MKTKSSSAFSTILLGLAILVQGATLRAAVQPSESLLFGPGSGHEPWTNGNLDGQAVGYITVAGQRHHALFTAVGHGVTHGMDLLVFDLDSQQLLQTFNIRDVAGAHDLYFNGQFLYFATITKPFLYRYDTTQFSLPPEQLVEIPSSAPGSAAWNGYAAGVIVGPDHDQAVSIKNGIDVSSSDFKGVYLGATYSGHLYRYTQVGGLEDLGQIKADEIAGRFPQIWKNYLVYGTGVLNPSVALYDIASGSFMNTSPPDLAGVTTLVQARIYKQLRPDTAVDKGPDIVYVTFDGLSRVIYSLNLDLWVHGALPSAYWKKYEFPSSTPPTPVTGISFPDTELTIRSAMVYRSPDTTNDSLMINSVAGPSIESLGYNGGPAVFAATANDGDDFYFSSMLPGYLFSGNLANGNLSNRFPYIIGGESYSLMVQTLSSGKRMLYSANYAGGSPLGVTDLADTSKITKVSFQLPSGENLPSDWRPRAMARDSRGMIYMGAQHGYGAGDGYLVRFNPESTIRYVDSPLFSNYYSDYHVMTIPGQSVTALFPSDPFLVGGTMNTIGVGAPLVADSAQLFLYCGQDAGACLGRRDSLITAVNLAGIPNRDNPAQLLTVTSVDAIASLADGQYTATVQFANGNGYLHFAVLSPDGYNPTIVVKEAAVLPSFVVDGNYEYWNPASFAQVGGTLYAGSSSRIYIVGMESDHVTYTPVFNTSFHRVEIGGLLSNQGNLYYSSNDNVFKMGPIPAGPVMGTPTVTDRSYATVTLSWPAATQASGTLRYDIERSQRGADGPFVPIASIRETTYKDTGLTPDATYFYRLHAVDEGALQTALGTFDVRSVYSAPVPGQTLGLPAFTENFDLETSGGSPTRWDTHNDAGTSVTIDETVHHGRSGKSLHLLDQSASGYTQIEHFTGAFLDSVYYKASVLLKSKNQESYVFLGDGDKTSIWFLTAYNGKWSYSDGSALYRFPNDTDGFEAGRWYDVEVEADFTKGTYGAWVNGVSIGQGIPISSGNTSLKGFRILPAGTPPQGEIWVDDIYFATKRPPLDLLAPRLTNVQAQNVTDRSLTIAWQTDEPSDTNVRWGLTPALENGPFESASGEINHSSSFSGLEPGTVYYFQAQSQDSAGNNGTSDVLSVRTLDVAPPVAITTPHYNATYTAPQTVSIVAGVNGETARVDFYDGITLKQSVSGAPYAVSWSFGASENGVHAWTAKAIDAGGHSQTSSVVNLVVAIDTQAPSAPTAMILDGQAHAVALTWSPSVDAGGSGIGGYRLDVSTDSLFAHGLSGWQDRDLGVVTSTAVSGLPDLTVYYARVRAVDGAGNVSANSSIIAAKTLDTTPPEVTLTAPADNTLYVMPQTVTISANATDNAAVSKVQFFLDGSPYGTVTDTPYQIPWTIPLSAAGPHTWMAQAYDDAGNVTDSSIVHVRIEMDVQAPSVPTGLTGTGKIKSMDLAWSPSIDAGGSGVKGYSMDLSTESVFTSYLPGWENKFLGMVTSTSVAGLAADTVYYARVRAVDNMDNVSGNSPAVPTRTSVLNAEVLLPSDWLRARGTLSKSEDTWTYFESTETGGHYVYKRTTSGLSTSEYLRFSVLVKASAAPARGISVFFYNTDVYDNRGVANCVLSGPGSVTVVPGGEARGVVGTITSAGDGWYLCSVSAKLDSRNGSNMTFIILGLSDGNNIFAGDPSAGFQFKNPTVSSLPEDTQSPSVTMTSPVAGTEWTAAQTVRMTANAADNVGVTKVWFILDSVVVSTGTSAPYFYDWPITAANNGPHHWSAAAFDAMGNSSTTAAVPVTVNIKRIPSQPNGSIINIRANSFDVRWDAAADANRYVAAVYTAPDRTISAFVVQKETASLTIGLSDLAVDTRYYPFLQACNADGCSENASLSSVVTLAQTPGLKVRLEGKEAHLTIDPKGNPGHTKYVVELSQDNGPFQSATAKGDPLSPVLSGLAAGSAYQIRVRAENQAGVPTAWSDVQGLQLAPETLDGARVYPVPYRPNQGADGITFDRIPENGSIKIYTMDGQLVKTLGADADGKARWDLSNDAGHSIASGVFFAILESNGSHKRIKLIVQK